MSRKAHAAADVFPLMEGPDFDALVADVRERGLLEPIWLHKDGSILDGRNRHRACTAAGVTPAFRTWDGQGSAVEFVLSLNLHRRHLTSSQRAVVSLRVEPQLAVEAKELQRKATIRGNTTRTLPVEEIVPQLVEPERGPQARDQAGALCGVSGRYVADAKKIADEAPDLLPAVAQGDMTLPEAKKRLRLRKKAVKVAEIAAQEPAPLEAAGTFPVVYVDPPWRYEFSKSDTRAIENHYPTMALDEIKAMDVPADPDAVLFLWATSPKLAEAIEVVEAWGFTYLTCMVWVKPSIGMGYYARQRHELLLIAKRGDMKAPDPEDRPDSVIEAPAGDHSVKPDVVYEVIERMYPFAARVELFARRPRDGWAAWGNQAEAAA